MVGPGRASIWPRLLLRHLCVIEMQHILPLLLTPPGHGVCCCQGPDRLPLVQAQLEAPKMMSGCPTAGHRGQDLPPPLVNLRFLPGGRKQKAAE